MGAQDPCWLIILAGGLVAARSSFPGPGYATVSGLWDDGYGCTVYLK